MELLIDAASDEPGLAVSRDGVVLLSMTWRTQRNHSKELLPNVDRLLSEAGVKKEAVEAVFIDTGPGGYAALRVGVSTAKALAHGLGVAIVGIGRLELDAALVARDAGGRRIVAVHRAGRGDVAWAAYLGEPGNGWTEESPPRMAPSDSLREALRAADVVTGDVHGGLEPAIREARAAIATPHEHRVMALARLGHLRLASDRVDDPATLVPLYLRAPAIGPQKHD